MRISDWSSDVCSSDLQLFQLGARAGLHPGGDFLAAQFEKEVGAPVGCAGSKPGAHSVHPGWFAVQRSDWLSIQALQLPFARSRTRAMRLARSWTLMTPRAWSRLNRWLASIAWSR